MNVADDGVVFIRQMFHCAIFPPVLEGDEESVFDVDFRGRLAAVLVLFVKGFLEDFQHVVEGLLFDTKELIELSVAEC